MKTNTYTSALLTLVTFLIAFNLSASVITFNEEEYIDDIPFDTEKIYQEVMNENEMSLYSFEEEAYINDIPFNTYAIVMQVEYIAAVSVEFEKQEEENINDIPFDTREISDQLNYHLAVAEEFEMMEENNIDDIPFDTYLLVQSMAKQTCSSQFLMTADNSFLF